MIQKCLTLFLLKALQNGAGMWIGICFGIIAGIFAGDMWIKNRIEEKGVEGETKELFGGRLLLRKYHNTGAALNLGSRKRALVAGVSVALTAVVFILFLLTFRSLRMRPAEYFRTSLLCAFPNSSDNV